MDTSQTTSKFGQLSAIYRAERSFFGYTPHVLKSGIQKYGRRAEVDKGLWCLVEMDLFSLLEWDGPALDAYLKKHPGKPRTTIRAVVQRVRSNMINRLVVMMSEEVSVSAWWLPIKVKELYQKWCENRGAPDSRKHLVDTYLYLTSQRMIRLISDLKSVYLLPPDYVKPKQMDDLVRILDWITALYPAVYSDLAKVGDVDWDLTDCQENLRIYIKGIVYNLERGSDHVFHWIHRLCDLEKNHGVTKYKYVEAVWEILYRFIAKYPEYKFVEEAISALEFFFRKMGHREKPIYLYHAALLLIRRNEIDWKSEAPGIDTSRDHVERLYREHLAGGKMPVDDYILDLHTHGGKRADDCLETFALEGAFIENENVDFLRPDYREIYVLLKQELDFYRNNGLREQRKRWPLKVLSCQVNAPIWPLSSATMARINDAPQAQLKTAKFKKAVFIVEDLVFKGPYSCDDPRLLNNLKLTYAIQLLEEVLNLPEWARGSLPWDGIACWEDDQYYLVARNVGKTENIPVEMASSKIETDVPIVPRGGCVLRVSDAEKNGRLTEDIKIATLQHLYFRFLLGIGDSGTHNVLIRDDYKSTGRLIAGIDLEENRTIKDKKSRLACLFKKEPSKAQVALYEPALIEIKALRQPHLDQGTLGKLGAVGIDLESVKRNLEAWEPSMPAFSPSMRVESPVAIR